MSCRLDEFPDVDTLINTVNQMSMADQTTTSQHNDLDLSSLIVSEDKVDPSEVMNATFPGSILHIPPVESHELSDRTSNNMLAESEETRHEHETSPPVAKDTANLEQDKEKLKHDLQRRYQLLASNLEGLEEEVEMCQLQKIVVSIEKLMALKGTKIMQNIRS